MRKRSATAASWGLIVLVGLIAPCVLSAQPRDRPSVEFLFAFMRQACVAGQSFDIKSDREDRIEIKSGTSSSQLFTYSKSEINGAIGFANEALRSAENTAIRACMQKGLERIFELLVVETTQDKRFKAIWLVSNGKDISELMANPPSDVKFTMGRGNTEVRYTRTLFGAPFTMVQEIQGGKIRNSRAFLSATVAREATADREETLDAVLNSRRYKSRPLTKYNTEVSMSQCREAAENMKGFVASFGSRLIESDDSIRFAVRRKLNDKDIEVDLETLLPTWTQRGGKIKIAMLVPNDTATPKIYLDIRIGDASIMDADKVRPGIVFAAAYEFCDINVY